MYYRVDMKDRTGRVWGPYDYYMNSNRSGRLMTNIFYGMEWLLAPGADMEGGCRKFYKDYPHSRTYFTEEGWGLFEGSDGPAIWKAWCEDKGVTPRSVCVLRYSRTVCSSYVRSWTTAGRSPMLYLPGNAWLSLRCITHNT